MRAVTLQYLALGLAVGGAVLALAADAFDRRRAAAYLAALGLWGATACASVARFVPATPGAKAGLLGAGGTAAIVFTLAALAVTAGSRRFESEGNGGQQAGLIAFMAVATALIAGAVDLAVLFIAIEASALCAYALVATARDRRSEEAAVKYFVQGAVAAGALVLALAIMVGLYGGATGYPELAGAVATNGGSAAAFAMMLLVAVFAFKMGVFPFHAWAPDAYESAPATAAAFMAGAPKLAAVVAATVVLKQTVFGGLVPAAGLALAVLAAASIAYGNLAGLRQTSYTRMLGYSGIAQAGYMFVGLAVVADSQTLAVALLGATYALGAMGAFVAADAVRAVRPAWDGSVAGLAGLGRRRPWLGAAIAACMLSLTGIPLTAGFWGKLLVFSGAVVNGMGWLAAVGVVGSVVSFGYYGAVVRSMFLEDAPEGERDGSEPLADRFPVSVVLVSALLVVLLGVVPLFSGLGPLAAFLGL